jgi:methylmalonyl-CoA epimerase
MVGKIDHVGVVVKDLESSIEKYTSHLGLKMEGLEEVKVENAINRVAFFRVGESKIELVETTADTGLVADFLREKGEGIHHIAMEVHDLQEVFDRLRSQGVEFLWNRIIQGSRGTKVAFFKAEEFNGVYIELVQKH